MKVSVIAKLDEDWFEFETSQTKLRSILRHLKQLKGAKYAKRLVENKCKYILVDSTGKFAPIALREEVALQDFSKFDGLLVIEDIEGSGGVVIGALVDAGANAVVATAIGAVVNIAIAIALQYAIQALSPSPEYNTDPSVSQADRRLSNLFNGVPIIREQGGVCSLVFGRPFCGGVIISVGVFTSDVVA